MSHPLLIFISFNSRNVVPFFSSCSRYRVNCLPYATNGRQLSSINNAAVASYLTQASKKKRGIFYCSCFLQPCQLYRHAVSNIVRAGLLPVVSANVIFALGFYCETLFNRSDNIIELD